MDITGQKNKKLIHTSFKIGLLIKGVDGILEIIGGLLMLFLNPDRLNKLIRLITQGELSEDPKDIVANTLLSIGSHFSINEQNFDIFYLMSHGIVKFIIILLLWRAKLWAYPFSIVTLILFIAYQIYRYILGPSALLILLTIFDVIMIVLTYLEYQRMKSEHPKKDQ